MEDGGTGGGKDFASTSGTRGTTMYKQKANDVPVANSFEVLNKLGQQADDGRKRGPNGAEVGNSIGDGDRANGRVREGVRKGDGNGDKLGHGPGDEHNGKENNLGQKQRDVQAKTGGGTISVNGAEGERAALEKERGRGAANGDELRGDEHVYKQGRGDKRRAVGFAELEPRFGDKNNDEAVVRTGDVGDIGRGDTSGDVAAAEQEQGSNGNIVAAKGGSHVWGYGDNYKGDAHEVDDDPGYKMGDPGSALVGDSEGAVGDVALGDKFGDVSVNEVELGADRRVVVAKGRSLAHVSGGDTSICAHEAYDDVGTQMAGKDNAVVGDSAGDVDSMEGDDAGDVGSDMEGDGAGVLVRDDARGLQRVFVQEKNGQRAEAGSREIWDGGNKSTALINNSSGSKNKGGHRSDTEINRNQKHVRWADMSDDDEEQSDFLRDLEKVEKSIMGVRSQDMQKCVENREHLDLEPRGDRQHNSSFGAESTDSSFVPDTQALGSNDEQSWTNDSSPIYVHSRSDDDGGQSQHHERGRAKSRQRNKNDRRVTRSMQRDGKSGDSKSQSFK